MSIKIKNLILSFILIESHIRFYIKISRNFYYLVPFFGRWISFFLDWLLLLFYGVDLKSFSIDVKKLCISHPNGVLLGGNGIKSKGRVVINSGVKFGGVSPVNELYLKKHKEVSVFELGNNVIFGMGTCVIGPIKICDDVIIGSMSLVNKNITESGVYVGIPVRKIAEYDPKLWP